MVAHNSTNPTSQHTMGEKSTSFSVFLGNIPELNLPELPWVTCPSRSQTLRWAMLNAGARISLSHLLIPGAQGSGSAPPEPQRTSEGGKIPPRKPRVQLPEKGGRVARWVDWPTNSPFGHAVNLGRATLGAWFPSPSPPCTTATPALPVA